VISLADFIVMYLLCPETTLPGLYQVILLLLE
jgi:hypothetical protein